VALGSHRQQSCQHLLLALWLQNRQVAEEGSATDGMVQTGLQLADNPGFVLWGEPFLSTALQGLQAAQSLPVLPVQSSGVRLAPHFSKLGIEDLFFELNVRPCHSIQLPSQVVCRQQVTLFKGFQNLRKSAGQMLMVPQKLFLE
jgi:hypothetical protein